MRDDVAGRHSIDATHGKQQVGGATGQQLIGAIHRGLGVAQPPWHCRHRLGSAADDEELRLWL